MSSGRSPFPSRTRRRLSSERTGDSGHPHSASSSFSSPLLMGSLLSQSRLSPAASWSPAAAAPSSSSRRPRRFFDSDWKDGGVLGTAIPSAAMGTTGARTPASVSNGRGALDEAHTSQHSQALDDSDTDDALVDGMNLAQLRSLSLNSSQNSPSMAVFYASLVYSKTHSSEDTLLYGNALFANGETRRCVRLLERAGLLATDDLKTRIEATLLATHSLFTLGEWPEAQALIESFAALDDDDDAGWYDLAQTISPVSPTQIHPLSKLLFWRGRAYDETSHPTRAALFWKLSLSIDSKCVQSLDALLERNVVTPLDAYHLITSLSFDESMDWMRNLYLARIDVYPPQDEDEIVGHPPTPSFAGRMDASSIHMATPSLMADNLLDAKDENNQKLPARTSVQKDVDAAFEKLWTLHKLDQSPDALALAAIRSYRKYDLQAALSFCQELVTMDPLCPSASFVYVATLLALDHKRVLFGLAHEWVEASPKSARAWFAVGSYYFACRRYHVAQRHFCRATRLDPQCIEAWIAFGCAFAACDESDQALASFRAAQRLAPAQHVALLYMGMEYLRTNHLVLAQHFLTAAYKSSGGDPLCLHELGVAAYHRRDFANAIVWFTRALKAVATIKTETQNGSAVHHYIDSCQDPFWEPTLFNLGQCYRKTRQYADALQCFEKCLALCPGSASSLTAMGFTKHLTGDTDGAIELYHQALSRKPDDPFSSEMLNRALQEALFSRPEGDNNSRRMQSFRGETSAFLSPAPERSVAFRSPLNLDSSADDSILFRSVARSIGARSEFNASNAMDEGRSFSLDSDDIDMSMS